MLIPSLGLGIYHVIGCLLLDLCGRLDSVLEQSALQLRPVEIDVLMRDTAPAGELVHVSSGDSGVGASLVESEDIFLPCEQLLDAVQPLLHTDFMFHK